MNTQNFLFKNPLFFVALLLMAGASIRAGFAATDSYTFASEFKGGMLTGEFSGEDDNGNGVLELSELTNFSATYKAFETEPKIAVWDQEDVRRFAIDLNSRQIRMLAIATEEVSRSGIACNLEFILRLGGYVEGRDLIEIERSSGLVDKNCRNAFPNFQDYEEKAVEIRPKTESTTAIEEAE
ncbi:MAG: hypothetical protein ACP5D7_18425 [Limnospira sp.]